VNAACALLLLFVMAEAVAEAEASQPRPLPLPLSLAAPQLPLLLQLLKVPLLSSQPFSWGLGLQEPGQGVHTGALGAHFDFHPQNHYK